MMFAVRKSFKHLANFFSSRVLPIILPLKYVNAPVFSGFSGEKILFFAPGQRRTPPRPTERVAKAVASERIYDAATHLPRLRESIAKPMTTAAWRQG